MPSNADAVVTADGRLRLGDRSFPCTLGRGGIVRDKREGDGATPVGSFALRRVLYRADRLRLPAGRLARTPIRLQDGWCDDPADPRYNRMVGLPCGAGAERLWREDGLYDLVVVPGHNDAPPLTGAGSAIFLHVAAPDGSPTAGCVGLGLADLLEVVRTLGPESRLVVLPPQPVAGGR